MRTVTGHTATQQGAKHIKRLCDHWAHKFDVEQSEGNGVIRFAEATVSLSATEAELRVAVTSNEEDLEKMKRVVASHLERMAWREAPPSIQWDA